MNYNARPKPPNGPERSKKRAKKPVALLRNGGRDNEDEYQNANAAEDGVRQRFIETYELSFGNVTYCCDVAGISRTTFYRWKHGKCARDIEFQRRLEEIKPAERFLDLAEGRLAKLMASADERVALAAVQFVLRTRGKLRGYSTDPPEQQNLEQALIEESFRQLKATIEQRAKEEGHGFQEELKFFFTLPVSETLKPEIREMLMKELET